MWVQPCNASTSMHTLSFLTVRPEKGALEHPVFAQTLNFNLKKRQFCTQKNFVKK